MSNYSFQGQNPLRRQRKLISQPLQRPMIQSNAPLATTTIHPPTHSDKSVSLLTNLLFLLSI